METNLEKLRNTCITCNKCSLSNKRHNVVFGDGNINTDIMFIGEAPGADEDATGIPFVGKAGQLLNIALKSLEIERNDCYICNICKCRPPNNRVPTEDEAKCCLPYLEEQIKIINPKIIVSLGATPLKYLINADYRITQIRGTWFERNGIMIMPTFHPAALLRDESKKLPFWEDLKNVRDKILSGT